VAGWPVTHALKEGMNYTWWRSHHSQPMSAVLGIKVSCLLPWSDRVGEWVAGQALLEDSSATMWSVFAREMTSICGQAG
jgi:hypothetical protein